MSDNMYLSNLVSPQAYHRENQPDTGQGNCVSAHKLTYFYMFYVHKYCQI